MRRIASWRERQPIPSTRRREWTTAVPLDAATTAPAGPGLLVIQDKNHDIKHIEACDNVNESAERLASCNIKENPFAWNLLLGVPLASETAMRSKARSQFKAQGLTFEWTDVPTLDGLAEAVQKQLESWGYDSEVVTG